MDIFVSGSCRDEERNAEFAEACRKLGAAIAKAGHRLVIGSLNPRTADHHVALGYIAENGCKEVIFSRTAKELAGDAAVVGQIKAACKLSFYNIDTDYSVQRLLVVKRVSAVILIGGGQGTYLMGTLAELLGRPVLGIGSFGGAAEQTWNRIKGKYTIPEDLGVALETLSNTWDETLVEPVLRAAEYLFENGAPQRQANIAADVRKLIALGLSLLLWLGLLAMPGSILSVCDYCSQHGGPFRIAQPAAAPPESGPAAPAVGPDVPAGVAAPPISGIELPFGEVLSFLAFLCLIFSSIFGSLLRQYMLALKTFQLASLSNRTFFEIAIGMIVSTIASMLIIIGGYTVTGQTVSFAVSSIESFQRLALVLSAAGFFAGFFTDKVIHWIEGKFSSVFTEG